MAKCDMFLTVMGEKHGLIKGESVDSAHANDIEVIGWNWGVRSPDLAGKATGKRAFLELQIQKRVDCATPNLYSALAGNETLKKVTLTVRKAGGGPQNYFTIIIEKARITSVVTRSGEGEHPEILVEQVSFAFRKIDMTYRGQAADGTLTAAVTFNDEIDAG